MNRSIKPLPDAKVLRQTHFGSKVISFAAIVFPSNAWDTGCSNGPPDGNGGWERGYRPYTQALEMSVRSVYSRDTCTGETPNAGSGLPPKIAGV